MLSRYIAFMLLGFILAVILMQRDDINIRLDNYNLKQDIIYVININTKLRSVNYELMLFNLELLKIAHDCTSIVKYNIIQMKLKELYINNRGKNEQTSD